MKDQTYPTRRGLLCTQHGVATFALAVIASLAVSGCNRKPPPWADALAATTIRYDAAPRSETEKADEIRLQMQFAPPVVQSAESKAGRDWSTWVRHEVLISVEKGPSSMWLYAKAIGADGIERSCDIEGGYVLPDAGNKAKRVLLIPNMPDISALEIGDNGDFKFKAKYSAGAWTVPDTPESERLRAAQEKRQAVEARLTAGRAAAAELQPCCDGLEWLEKGLPRRIEKVSFAAGMCVGQQLELSEGRTTMSSAKEAMRKALGPMKDVPKGCEKWR